VLDDLRAVRQGRPALQQRASAEGRQLAHDVPLTGVLGWPVAHSRSPAMHEAAYGALGLEGWRYQRLPVPPALFAETTRALAAAGGEEAAAIGAANTLTFSYGRVRADNTDAPGLLAALGEPVEGRTALVLGAGGAARAAVWALLGAGARDVMVWNRTPERA